MSSPLRHSATLRLCVKIYSPLHFFNAEAPRRGGTQSFSLQPIYHPFKAIHYSRFPEIYNHTKLKTRNLQVCQQLRSKDWIMLVNRLAFNNNFTSHQKIYAISFIQCHAFIHQLYRALSFQLHAPHFQLLDKCRFIARLQQSGTAKRFMNSNRRIKNNFTYLILMHTQTFSAVLRAIATLR